MTAGREQDARETPDLLSVRNRLIVRLTRERNEARTEVARLAALLPSPPATTDEDADFHPETGHAHTCTDPTSCDCAARLYNLAASLSERLYASPPATTGAEDERPHELTPSGGPAPKHAPWCWCQAYLTSPPATDGDAATRRATCPTCRGKGTLRVIDGSDCAHPLGDACGCPVGESCDCGASNCHAPPPYRPDRDTETETR